MLKPLLLLLCSFLPLGGFAQSSLRPPLHSPATDPTEFGSLRLDPFESVAPDGGEWVFLVGASYFNQWNGTWHTRRVHEDLGRARQPIGDDELRYLEGAFPDDDIFRLDIEGSRFDLLLARGFGKGVSLQARIPWIVVGSPSWDGVAESFHELIPVVEHYVRDLFPRGETFVYLRAQGRSVVRRGELARSGVGDVALSLGVPLRMTARTTQRLVATIELPTGEKDSLHGSGGYDAGIRWFVTRTGVRNDLLLGAGYTHNSGAGSLFGFERSDTLHLSADWTRRFTQRTRFHAGVRADTSPLSKITTMNLAEPVIFYRFGIQREMLPRQWMTLQLGEEIVPQMGVDADFAFQLSWSVVARGE